MRRRFLPDSSIFFAQKSTSHEEIAAASLQWVSEDGAGGRSRYDFDVLRLMRIDVFSWHFACRDTRLLHILKLQVHVRDASRWIRAWEMFGKHEFMFHMFETGPGELMNEQDLSFSNDGALCEKNALGDAVVAACSSLL